MKTTSYRPGNAIVTLTLLASLGLCLAVVNTQTSAPRAGENLGDNPFPLGTFRLTERSGRAVTDADLASEVYVTSFIFTRCPLSCPKITSVMKGLQSKFEGIAVKLVSITVDPDHDTPAVLAEYARRFGADPDRWWFLTGPKAETLDLIQGRFKLTAIATSDDDQRAGAEAFSHSSRLALVDHGKVVGLYDSADPERLAVLIRTARALAGKDAPVPAWARRLPAVNATLNGTCAVLLAIGWLMIRSGRTYAHAACMISAVVVSALFLTCYLVYHFEVGSVPFRGEGPVRLAYFTILLSHTVLATLGVVPLVTITLYQAYRRRFDRHSRVARVTFPIWMYVSVTGVIIYLMLYQLPLAASA